MERLSQYAVRVSAAKLNDFLFLFEVGSGEGVRFVRRCLLRPGDGGRWELEVDILIPKIRK